MGKSMKKEKLFIEFIGLPGSGKTTLAHKVVERLSAQDYRCETRSPAFKRGFVGVIGKYIYGIFFITSHLIAVVQFFYFCSRTQNLKKFPVVLKKIISQYKILTRSCDMAVFDQGAINIFLYTAREDANWKYFNKVYSRLLGIKNLYVVFINLDFSVAIKRSKNRASKKHWTEIYKEEKIKEIFSKYTNNAKRFLSAGNGIFGIITDGQKDVLENSKKIVDSINKLRKRNQGRIAFFLPSLRGGGAERMFVNLTNGFASRGLKVDLVLAQKEGPYLKDVSNKVRIIDLGVKRVLFSLLPLIKYLRTEKPAALISSMEHANIIAGLAKFLARSKTKVIARAANTLSFSLKGTKWNKRWLRKYGAMIFYRFANEIVANSKGSADDLARTLKIPRERIRVIYNPTIIPDVFKKAREEIDHSWLNNKTSPVIMGVGRLRKQKDFSTLIRAFAKLREKKDARLIILGEGEDRKKLENLIKKLSLQDYVDLPGFVKNPYAYMARADVFVLSSRWEGLPNTLIEAMACGTPVISTDCPSGPAEILEGGKYGKLVPVGDVNALANAILEILENPLDKKILQERARFFSAEKAVGKYLKIL